MDGAVQYRGVNQNPSSRDRKAGKWTAVMTLPATDKEPASKLIIGTFQTQKDAARHYDKATYIRKSDKARQEGRPLEIASLNLNFPEELTQEERVKLDRISLEEFLATTAGSVKIRPAAAPSPSPRGMLELKEESEDTLDLIEGKGPGKRVQKKRIVKDLGAQHLKRKATKTIKKVWKAKKREVGSIKELSIAKKARLLDTSEKWKGPNGWKVRVWQRHGEKGGYDMQIVSPSGEVMRSLKQLEEYLNSHGGGDINEFILPYKSPKRLPKKKKGRAEGRVRKTGKVSTPTPVLTPVPVPAPTLAPVPAPAAAQKKPVRAKALKSPSVSEREAGTSGPSLTPYSCPEGFELHVQIPNMQLKDGTLSNATTEWTITTPDGELIRSRPQLIEYLTKTNRTMEGFILPHKGGAREGTRANNKAIGQEPEPPPSPTSKRKFNRRKRKDQGPWVRKVNKKSRQEEGSPGAAELFGRERRDQGEGDIDHANQAGQKDIMMVDASLQTTDKAGIAATSSSSPDQALITTDDKGAGVVLTSADSQHGNGLGAMLLPPPTTVNTRLVHYPPSSRQVRSFEPIVTGSEKEQSASGDTKQDKVATLVEPTVGLSHPVLEGGGVSPNMAGPLTPAPGFKITSGGVVVPVSVSGPEGIMMTKKDGISVGNAGEVAAAAAAVERELAMSEVERYNELDASLDEQILRKMQEVSRLAQQQTEVRQKVREQIAKAEMEREVEVLQLRQAEAAYKAEIEALKAQHAAAMQQLQQELLQERATSHSLQQRLEKELAQERAGGRAHVAELEASISSLQAERQRLEADQQALRHSLHAKAKSQAEKEMERTKDRAQAEEGELLATRDFMSQENGRPLGERDNLQSLFQIRDQYGRDSAFVNGADPSAEDAAAMKMSG